MSPARPRSRYDLWAAAGLTHPNGDGRLGGHTRATTWRVPSRIWLDGQSLRWRWNRRGERDRVAAAEPDLLEAFISLESGTAESVLAFATRFGILETCVHEVCDHPGVSRRHGVSCRLLVPGAEGEGAMPVASWVHLAGKVASVLNVAAQLRLAKIPDLADLENFAPSAEAVATLARREKSAWPFYAAINAAMNHSLLPYLEPNFFWQDDTEPILSLRPRGPFGAVAFQAAIVISRTNGLSLCDGCGETFVPERRPRRGERSYCLDCRKKNIPRRDASRAFRERSRGEKK